MPKYSKRAKGNQENFDINAMKATKRKRVITVETLERTVIRQSLRQTKSLWCEFCEAEVGMTTPEQMAVWLGTTPREIYRRIENGELHFIEMGTDEIFICCNQF